MKVVCVADLHGRLPEIPECDVLVIAGDICPDVERVYWDADLSRAGQTQWLADEYYLWEQQVPAREIFATPGNHDWVSKFPENCRSKMFVDETVEFEEKKFYFTPWVSNCGDWNYILDRSRRKGMFAYIPYKLDLLVMHAPAFGVGDMTYSNEPAGCPEMRAAIQQKQPRYATFGHIHEGQRYGREFRLGGTKLFHASMWGESWTPISLTI